MLKILLILKIMWPQAAIKQVLNSDYSEFEHHKIIHFISNSGDAVITTRYIHT